MWQGVGHTSEDLPPPDMFPEATPNRNLISLMTLLPVEYKSVIPFSKGVTPYLRFGLLSRKGCKPKLELSRVTRFTMETLFSGCLYAE